MNSFAFATIRSEIVLLTLKLCQLHETDTRKIFFDNIIKTCPNFENLNNDHKLHYILTSEDNRVIHLTAKYLSNTISIRENHL